MKNLMSVFISSFRRDQKNYLSYKFNLIGELFFNFIVVILLFYMSLTFENSTSSYLEKYHNNYFLFLVTGVMILLFMSRLLSSIVSSVTQAQTLGYFESLMNNKADIYYVLLSSCAFPLFQACMRVLLIALFAFFYDQESFNFFQIFELLGLILLSSLPFIGVSLIFCSIVIPFKRASFLISFYLVANMIFSGAFYPNDVLPKNLQLLSYFFPSFYAIDLVRGRILENESYSDLTLVILSLVVMALLFFIISKKLLIFGINRAKHDGTIGQF